MEATRELTVPSIDYGLLVRARKELEKASASLNEAAWDRPSDSARNFGRCAEAADAAQNAVFGLVNCLNAYLGAPGANDALNDMLASDR